MKAIFLKKVDNTKESCMEFDKVVTTLLSNFTHPPNLNFTEGDFKLVGVSLKSAIDFWIKQNHSHESIWAVICLKLGTLLLKSANNLGILNFCKFSKLCGYVIAKSSNTKVIVLSNCVIILIYTIRETSSYHFWMLPRAC